MEPLTLHPHTAPPLPGEEPLFGWNPTPGIVSVWASRSGKAWVLLAGASRRLNRKITSLSALGDSYYRVGPVEQYLMLTGRVFFHGMAYHDLHRLQFDLETTSLDPARGRIFLVAIRDNHGFEQVLEAATPEEEATLIANLCALIRQRDPDTIENHNLMGFALP